MTLSLSRAISSSDRRRFVRILSRPAITLPGDQKPIKCVIAVEVLPASVSCLCFIMAVRDFPRPSSNIDVVKVPIKVDVPASTLPTTASQMLFLDNVSSREDKFLSSPTMRGEDSADSELIK